jgi:hypothetical protein
VQHTQQFLAEQRRREIEEEKEMRRFNKRLKDMIREGREALGTRVEVLDLDDDDDCGEPGVESDEGLVDGF